MCSPAKIASLSPPFFFDMACNVSFFLVFCSTPSYYALGKGLNAPLSGQFLDDKIH